MDFLDYHFFPTHEKRNQLIRDNIGLARKLAHSMKGKCNLPYEDLEQLAAIGLTKAIERFDPHRGVKFSTFAAPYIKGEIQHFLRDKSSLVKVPRRYQELLSKAKKIQKETGRRATPEQIGCSSDEWEEVQIAEKNYHRHYSLDASDRELVGVLSVKGLQFEVAGSERLSAILKLINDDPTPEYIKLLAEAIA